MRTIFHQFDTDNTGKLEIEEFKNFAHSLGANPDLTEEEINEAMLQLDLSNDKRISFDEFWIWWIND